MTVREVPNLIQGVSQQAASQRRDSQCEAQLNCFNSPTDGAGARPHFDFVKMLSASDFTNAYFAEFLREGLEYVVGVRADAPFAFNLATGAACTVTQTAGTGYLATGTPENKASAHMVAVEDTIFVLNKEAVPAMDAASVEAAQDPFAYVVMIYTKPGQVYTITVTGPLADFSVSTGDSIVASHSVSAALVAPLNSDTLAALAALIHGKNGYVVVQQGDSMRIDRSAGANFTITVDDGNAGTTMYALKGKIDAFEKLPPKGYTGDIVKVTGESKMVDDDYYLTWAGGLDAGYWEEVIGTGVEQELDAAKMPHLLVNTATNTFEYKQAVWSDRVVGDLDTNPDPSFIGSKIVDMFYHENRLSLLLPSGCFWSKSQFPYTMFPDTVQTILATAPVDLKTIRSGGTSGTSSFTFGVSFNETLSLWAQRAQYRVATGDDNIFKEGSVSAKPSTAFEYAASCRPEPIGSGLLFASENGAWATLRTLTSEKVASVNLTRHVAHYIPSGVKQITSSDVLGCTFVRTEGDTGKLWLHNVLEERNEFIQSAWNIWTVPGGALLWVTLLQNKLYAIQQRAEGCALLVCDLTSSRVDDVAGATYLTRLDLRVTEAEVTGLAYSAPSTTFTLPYKPTGTVLVITSEDEAGGYTRGRSFAVTDVTDYTVTVTGDLTGYSFYVGEVISATRTESPFYDRGRDGPVSWERLTVESFSVSMANTGYTRIEVTKPNKSGVASKAVFEGRTLDSSTSLLETNIPQDLDLSVGVGELSKNCTITLINDTYLPSYWQSAAYTSTGVRKGGTRERT